MRQRIDYTNADPLSPKAMLSLQARVDSCGLEHGLLYLVKVRASQINGCAFCIDMHTKDARALGETEQRLYMLDAWAETGFFNDRERAALAWTEAVTFIGQGHVTNEVYASVREHFDEEALVKLTLAVVAINAWNRICIAFRVTPGSYQVASKPGAQEAAT